jgi:hypothetical protein
MVCVNQTRPHCVNKMGKTKSKALAERHGMRESVFRVIQSKFHNEGPQILSDTTPHNIRSQQQPGAWELCTPDVDKDIP